ncbi:hypothetical protein LA6_004888 [Marinibacterium anthonyi]|nr:hypothetical protein LA6_004888 [Marinibacterium anthonyi]
MKRPVTGPRGSVGPSIRAVFVSGNSVATGRPPDTTSSRQASRCRVSRSCAASRASLRFACGSGDATGTALSRPRRYQRDIVRNQPASRSKSYWKLSTGDVVTHGSEISGLPLTSPSARIASPSRQTRNQLSIIGAPSRLPELGPASACSIADNKSSQLMYRILQASLSDGSQSCPWIVHRDMIEAPIEIDPVRAELIKRAKTVVPRAPGI